MRKRKSAGILLALIVALGNIAGSSPVLAKTALTKQKIKSSYEKMTLLDISKGSIIINQDTVTGFDTAGNPVSDVNLQGYHIISSSGQTSNKITVESGVRTTIVVDNLNIDNQTTDEINPSPLFIRPGAIVTLKLEGKNRFQGASYNAAVGVPQASDGTMAELIIEGNGSLEARTGKRGAGIGGGQRCGYTEGAGMITINSGTIHAYGGDYGGGIGNSERNGPKNSIIQINGGNVYAQSSSQSSGLGGSRYREGPKADIIINGGIIRTIGPDKGVHGNLQLNGGNLIAQATNDQSHWQAFSSLPTDQYGNAVKVASVQLDWIDADKELTFTYDGKTHPIKSDSNSRVNIPMIQGYDTNLVIASTTGNEYELDYSTLPSNRSISDKPYRHPLLTITPKSDQSSEYGNVFNPAYDVFDADDNIIQTDKSILTGNLSYQPNSYYFLPQTVMITQGDIAVIDGKHCITVTPYVSAMITKRKLTVSVKDLSVYEGQYTRYNYPFEFQIEEGSFLPDDTISSAFTFTVDSYQGKDAYPVGDYSNINVHFSSRYYDVSLKNEAVLHVLENDSLLKQGEQLTFGKAEQSSPVEWMVAYVSDQQAFLYSKYVYDSITFSEAQEIRNHTDSYLNDKFPSLQSYDFVKATDILDYQNADQIAMQGGLSLQQANHVDGSPAAYWIFNDGTFDHDKPVLIDTQGSLQEIKDSSENAGLRLFSIIDIRTHTVPILSLSDTISTSTKYGDIKAGSIVAKVQDGAVMSGHTCESLVLLDKTTHAENFTLKDDGSITANKTLAAGTYTLYVQSRDTTGYTAERSITFTVKQRQLTITPQMGITMNLGDEIPSIPYSYDEKQLLSGDNLHGELGFDGDLLTAGEYPITIGSLEAGNNYQLVLAGNAFVTVYPKTPDVFDEDDEKNNPENPDTPREEMNVQKGPKTGDIVPAESFFLLMMVSIGTISVVRHLMKKNRQ